MDEKDAQRLVDRLQSEKLPAFYESSGLKNGSDSPKFYVVLLGRDVSYSDSKSRLSTFKRLPVYQDFKDAFIRRL